MLDLARIAVDKLQRRRHAVAEAVNQLYAPARASWILTELAEWTKTPELQIHAARALLALVRRVEPNAPDGRPELLERLAGESENVEHLGRLWLVAFLDSDTAPAAADGLARWIRHADANDEFRPHIVALLDAFGTSPMARRRIDFYLKRMTWLSDGLPDWARGERRRDS
jgi:hypothetical protein